MDLIQQIRNAVDEKSRTIEDLRNRIKVVSDDLEHNMKLFSERDIEIVKLKEELQQIERQKQIAREADERAAERIKKMKARNEELEERNRMLMDEKNNAALLETKMKDQIAVLSKAMNEEEIREAEEHRKKQEEMLARKESIQQNIQELEKKISTIREISQKARDATQQSITKKVVEHNAMMSERNRTSQNTKNQIVVLSKELKSTQNQISKQVASLHRTKEREENKLKKLKEDFDAQVAAKKGVYESLIQNNQAKLYNLNTRLTDVSRANQKKTEKVSELEGQLSDVQTQSTESFQALVQKFKSAKESIRVLREELENNESTEEQLRNGITEESNALKQLQIDAANAQQAITELRQRFNDEENNERGMLLTDCIAVRKKEREDTENQNKQLVDLCRAAKDELTRAYNIAVQEKNAYGDVMEQIRRVKDQLNELRFEPFESKISAIEIKPQSSELSVSSDDTSIIDEMEKELEEAKDILKENEQNAEKQRAKKAEYAALKKENKTLKQMKNRIEFMLAEVDRFQKENKLLQRRLTK